MHTLCKRANMGGVADLLWDDVRDMLDPQANGVLPDVRITATTIDDWQTVLSMARSKGWRYEYEEQGRVVRMPFHAEDILRRAVTAFPVVRIWPVRGLLAIFRPARVDEIAFDVDLREFQGQQRLDELCAFLRAIGRRLNKPVLMYPEGGADQADLGYSPTLGRVVKLRRE